VAKVIRPKGRKAIRETPLPLERQNFIILGIGLLVILLGYAAMYNAPVEGFLPLVVSPILLVLGYCVIIPIGILYRKRNAEPEQPVSTAEQAKA
jgi:hypothetical protein